MRRPIHVYEGQPGMAPILNRVMDVCAEHMVDDVSGGITTAELVDPAAILRIIEGDFE